MGIILDISSGKEKENAKRLVFRLSEKTEFKLTGFQVVPGRMGLLVTLFLSLTALLVSTITSSPEVKI